MSDEPRISVMVVDDHPIWRDGVARDLTEHGFDVRATAPDAGAALRIARTVQPGRPHGNTTALRVRPSRWSASASPVAASGRRCWMSGAGSISPRASRSSAARMSAGPADQLAVTQHRH